MAARVLPDVIADKAACRAALLHAFSGPHDRADLVLDGLRKLGVNRDDEEAFRAALEYEASLRAPLYRKLWRAGMIQTFPWRKEVRDLALQEIDRRDGEIAAVANAYPDDPEICRKLLETLLPLPPAARLSILQPLQDAALSNPAAESRLGQIRFDSERIHGAIATIAHAEVLVAREAVTADDIAFWERELDAVGPNYEQRRMAGIIALATAGEISRFVVKKDHKGEPEKIHLAMVSPEGSPLYLNKLLPMWASSPPLSAPKPSSSIASDIRRDSSSPPRSHSAQCRAPLRGSVPSARDASPAACRDPAPDPLQAPQQGTARAHPHASCCPPKTNAISAVAETSSTGAPSWPPRSTPSNITMTLNSARS